jgi:hypothetical protein
MAMGLLNGLAEKQSRVVAPVEVENLNKLPTLSRISIDPPKRRIIRAFVLLLIIVY